MQFSINPWNFTKILQLTYKPNHLCNNVIKHDDINKGPKVGGTFFVQACFLQPPQKKGLR